MNYLEQIHRIFRCKVDRRVDINERSAAFLQSAMVARDGNFVVVYVVLEWPGIYERRAAVGVSKCNPIDDFDVSVGVELAAHRAIENAIAGTAEPEWTAGI